MSKPKSFKFASTDFKLSSGFASANPISGSITNANPAVMTDTGHGKTVGVPFVAKLTGLTGMTELNDQLVVLLPTAANTIELVGVDSTNYGVHTAASGNWLEVTYNGSCQMTEYTSDTGATPISEEETNCGIVTTPGAPRLGSVSLNFLDANEAFVNSLYTHQAAVTECVLRVQKPGDTRVGFDIGWIVQVQESGSSGGSWSGSASFTRSQAKVKVTTA